MIVLDTGVASESLKPQPDLVQYLQISNSP
jgi:predicted nucleic acid-binding protein